MGGGRREERGGRRVRGKLMLSIIKILLSSIPPVPKDSIGVKYYEILLKFHHDTQETKVEFDAAMNNTDRKR